MSDESDNPTDRDLLLRIARELATLRQLTSTAVNALKDAEGEVPERMRRFANYFHDVVHIRGEYVSLGLKVPDWIDREMERCADRYRHILEDLQQSGEAFERVRRDMVERPDNVYDHTRQLEKPKS